MTARRIVATTGADGRSCLAAGGSPADGSPTGVFRFGGALGNSDPHRLTGSARSADRSPAADGEVVITNLWQSSETEPAGSDPGSERFDVETPPGGTRWRIVEMGPHRTAPTHATKTLDYDLVLAGEIDLLLDAGPVRLHPGDTAVLPGVTHGWQTGSGPCTMAVVQIALP
jgi:quercetin dioxygenase-like cupin family protein